MVVSDVNRQLGLEWKGMGKEDKQKYFDMYEKDKQRYAVELASYSSSANSALPSSDASIPGSRSTKSSAIGIDRLLSSEKSEKVGITGADDMNEIDENDTEDDDADGDAFANQVSESQSSQNSHNWDNGDAFLQSSHNIPHSSSSNERPGLSTLPHSQQNLGQNQTDTQSYRKFAASNGSSTTPHNPLSSYTTSSSTNHGGSNGEQMDVDVDVDVDVEGDEDDEDSDPEMF